MTKFNKQLIKSQDVSEDQQVELDHLYTLLEGLFTLAKDLQLSNDLTFTTGSIISNTLRDIEFMLQKNWNFKQNEDKHSYWYKLPGCTCAKMDNKERWGTPYAIITQNCPYHGSKEFHESIK